MRFIAFFAILLFPSIALSSVSQWIPFEDHNGHIKISVSVSGIEGYAILDTGATISSINKSFLLKHNLSFPEGREVTLRGVHGEVKERFLRDIEVTLFGSPIKFKNMAPVSLGNPKNIVLLGSELFRSFVVQLDYPNQRMRLLTRDSIDLDKHKNINMRFDPQQGLPIVEVTLGEKDRLKLLLDTGSNGGVLLPRNVARKFGLLEKYSSGKALSSGIAKTVEMDTFAVPELKFGPFVMENVELSVPAKGSRYKIFEERKYTGTRLVKRAPDGILGYDVFKHFVLTIDYKKGKMHVGLPEE